MTGLTRLAISCGGTGGHFNPGLSVAREFNQKGGKALLLLGGKHAEKQILAAQKYGVEAVRIDSAAIPSNPLNVLPFLWASLKGIAQCRSHFREFNPQALLAMGSFASFPPAMAAYLSGVPLFLHDGNARIGKANRFLSRFAKALALSFPAVNSEASHCPTVLTGMPLRQEIVQGKIPKTDAIAIINERWNVAFNPEKPLLLVFGGSLGASSINNNFKPDKKIPGGENLQVIHLSGPGKYEELKLRYKDYAIPVLVIESTEDMQILYSAADMIISRSGGSSVSEIACFGKYAILIPYPYAAESHQDDNAAWLQSGGGAMIVKDADCSPIRFAGIVERFLADPEEYHRKGDASRDIAMPTASNNVIRLIENILSTEKTRSEAQA